MGGWSKSSERPKKIKYVARRNSKLHSMKRRRREFVDWLNNRKFIVNGDIVHERSCAAQCHNLLYKASRQAR